MSTCMPGSYQSSIQIDPAQPLATVRSYRVELPLNLLDEDGNTLDWLIGFTLDTLDAQHLDLRIVADPSASNRQL
jgi:hypothetical protein